MFQNDYQFPCDSIVFLIPCIEIEDLVEFSSIKGSCSLERLFVDVRYHLYLIQMQLNVRNGITFHISVTVEGTVQQPLPCRLLVHFWLWFPNRTKLYVYSREIISRLNGLDNTPSSFISFFSYLFLTNLERRQTQRLKCLSYEHEDQGSNPQNPAKKPAAKNGLQIRSANLS